MTAQRLGPHKKLGSWTPWQLTRSVLTAWWAADDLVDGSVTTWTDRIRGLGATQGSSGQRPLKASTSFNGAYPGVSFDGIDDNLTLGSTAGLPTGSTPGELWAVGNISALTGNAETSVAYGAGAATSRRLQTVSNAGAQPGAAVSSDGTTANTSNSLWTSPAIVKGDWSGTTANLYVNGTPSVQNPTTIATLNTGTTRLRFGATNATTPVNFWQGPLRHTLIITGVLSTELRQKMEGYFAWDSGLQLLLPASHPYRLFRP